MTIEITEDMIERAQDTDWQSAGSSREAIEKILTAVLNMPAVQEECAGAWIAMRLTEDVTEEPPIGARVRDRQGLTWVRKESGWGLAKSVSGVAVAPWSIVRTYAPLRRMP